ncbi:MAG: patatin-like phospholipase family protein [Sphingobacteriaceae bacterium]
MAMQKIGLVLSGGAIRGVAHLGAMQAINEAGLSIDKISGTSAGAIMGALYANGMNPEDILEIIANIKLYQHIRPHFGAGGLLSLQASEKLLKELLPHNTFKGLRIPLVTTAVNLANHQLVYFSEGELIPAIQASMAIPGVFKPVQIQDQLLVDGGILNNFPVEPLLNDCDFIIGSSCNAIPAFERIKSLKNTVERAALIVINADTAQKKTYCNLLIDPPGLGVFGLFELKKAKEIYSRAYDYAKGILEDKNLALK